MTVPDLTQEPTQEPTSAEALVDVIAKAAKTHHARTGRGIDGSSLAAFLKTKYPGLDYVKLGLTKLGDAVRLGEAKRLIKRNSDVKHLEVSPVDVDPTVKPRPPTHQNRVLGVKSELWRAAVLSPTVVSFLNRETGALSGSPSSSNDVQLSPVTEADQLAWLTEFLTSKGIADPDGDKLRSLLHGRIADDFGAPVERDWKFFRSRKAVEHVRQWAKQNKIPDSLVLISADHGARRRKSTTETSHHHSQDDDARRTAALAAIGELPLEELERIAVPLRYVFRHFTVK